MKQIQRLIFDADDTLWENNIFYLKAANDFFKLLINAGYQRIQVEYTFDQLEKSVVNDHGYGSINFIYILEELFKKYPVSTDNVRQKLNLIIDEFNAHKINKPLLFDHVKETMERLSADYDLYILTKGDYKEQELKIKNSGLSSFIQEYFILPEKNDQTYFDLLHTNNWSAEKVCMIGNSPKSDINPALRNNMYAVYIPYRNTWKLDIEPIINKNGKFIQISHFKELKNLFLND